MEGCDCLDAVSTAPSSFQWKLTINLQEDYETRIYDFLISLGYKDVSKQNAVYQYMNLFKRLIEPKPRKVYYSKEFQCPNEYKTALQEFEDRIRHGNDLTPFLSEKIKRADYNDMLLNDWGIYHFHLTRWFRDDGFAARSNYQIFAYITESAVYMLQIFPHNAENLYSRREFLIILRNNWPECIKPYRINGVVELCVKLDDSDYGKLREANVNSLVELGNNEVYGMIGGGFSANGFSTEVIQKRNSMIRCLKHYQDLLINHVVWIGKTINRLRRKNTDNVQLRIKFLWLDSFDKITVVEQNSSLIIQIDARENSIRICEPYECLNN